MPAQTARIALAGQPNVGKSTVFNMLTGLNQHVGNWPGKTIEQRSGTFEHHGIRFDIIDLPGTYSLTAASPEERVTRDFIIRENPEVVIVVINAASLERNLYLVAELLALSAPLVIGLNMMDVAKQEGYEIEPKVLAAAIGVPVIPMTAARGEGVHELIDAAVELVNQDTAQNPARPDVRPDHQQVLSQVKEIVADHVPEPYPPDWVALKLFEADQEITSMMHQALPPAQWDSLQAVLRDHEDAIMAVASGRYEWIRRMTRAALLKPHPGRITLTQRIDSIATHPLGGLVMLAAVLGIIFGLTYAVGSPIQEWLAQHVVDALATLITNALATAPGWITDLLVDGVIGGVGTVLTFIPILAVFFAGMGVLEDTGYMARAAYIMDRFMHALGLHGKSFIPLFLGFGCSVPAIMGTRIIESEKSRLLTIMLAPLVPCTARLAVLAVLVPVFFPNQATLVSWVLTGLPLIVLAISGVIIGQFVLRGDGAAFIMEMPLYHSPNPKTIGLLVWHRLIAFVRKAGSVILLVSIIVWALAVLPYGDIETSILASIGRLLEPVGALMGLSWKPLVALLTSFVAKENAVATLGVLYGVGKDSASLGSVLAASLSPASAFAFLSAEMLFVPCVSTLAVIKQETGSWKWAAVNVAFLTILTLIGGSIAYHVAKWVF